MVEKGSSLEGCPGVKATAVGDNLITVVGVGAERKTSSLLLGVSQSMIPKCGKHQRGDVPEKRSDDDIFRTVFGVC